MKSKHIMVCLSALAIFAIVGCSTKKNTATTRWWKSFNARYNTYYNASLAYIDASLEKENGNVDNYTELLPLYTVANKNSRELGKGNFDRSVEKCEKAIHLYSIKRRPEWPPGKRKTAKDREWLSRREYNPFLWKAWLLMGRSQFHQGAFEDAASTFAYMSRLYAKQPAIYGRARAWLAKCYVEQGWLYDAEDVIKKMQRDTIHWRAQKEWDYTYADYYMRLGDYSTAADYLRKVIKHEMRRKQKAREWFIMGQLQELLGHNELAYKAYKRVIRLNPPYQLEFNARIAMTEVMGQTNSSKMIRRLKSMARSDKNKQFLDQVYYAIGNLHLAQRDTLSAIAAYEKGREKAARAGIEKGVLLLTLGNLYWERENYSGAQQCYGEAIGLLDKERPDYAQLSNRSTVLDELVPFTDAVHLQDSLLSLSEMSETDRNAAIDRTIEALKKKEKEERRRQAEFDAANMAQNGTGGSEFDDEEASTTTTSTTSTMSQQQKSWYFYNPLAVSQGKAAFQKKWGQRKNEDDWQRSNKTVVAGIGSQTDEEMAQDTTETAADSLATEKDSVQNDPHKREYYLAQIPFTPEQKAACNEIIKDGLFQQGVIFKDKLNNLPRSEKALRRLSDHYPDYQNMDEAYYHLFLLYSRKGETTVAEGFVDSLKARFPDSKWTAILTDPYFEENARFGVQIEDSLYASTYDAFRADRVGEVDANVRLSETRFPLGANRDKFIFIGGMNSLNKGDADKCVAAMNEVVEKYPKSSLAELAGMIVNGVKAGRRLRGGRFAIGDVWQRRTAVMADSDGLKRREFSAERNVPFTFMIVYEPDSIDQNRLLFELAKYNFTSYLVRSFDIGIEPLGDVNRMTVSGFGSYDEALQYARAVYRQRNVVKAIGSHARTVVISDANIDLLGAQYSYDDYDKFYALHFAPLKTSTLNLLEEPSEIVVKKEESGDIQRSNAEGGTEGGGMFIVPDSGNAQQQAGGGTTVVAEPAATVPKANTTVVEPTIVAPEPSTTVVTEPNTTVVNEPATTAPKSNTTVVEPTIVAPEKKAESNASGIIIQPDVNESKPKPSGGVESQQGGTTIIVPQENAQKGGVESRQTIVPAASDVQKGRNEQSKAPLSPSRSTVVEGQKQPNQPSKAQLSPQKKQQQGTVIYFNDGFGDVKSQGKNATDAKKKKTEKKKKEFDLEDEYYDLKGF